MNPTEYDIQAVATRIRQLDEMIQRAEENIGQWRGQRNALNRWLIDQGTGGAT